ncbi:MAG: sigma 54-interacting transcriptional regulator [Firmicutes bacterium]|nr:sigma 54-interacting transcriptional regulator [Bacillota bacterium]
MNAEQYKKLVDELIELLDEGVYIVDKEGVGIHYNSAMARTEKVDVGDVLGKKFHEAFPDFKMGDSTIYKALIKNQKTSTDQQTYKNIYGKEITTENDTIPVIVNGETVAAIEVSKDITEIRSMSDTLLELREGALAGRTTEPAPEALGIRSYTFDDIWGENQVFETVLERARKAAGNQASVFIYGETGTGKELFAQSIHNMSKRANKPFLAQNCAAIPESLLEGILFGTTKGSFTGAVDRAGLFEQANGGTLLLDEISAMPYDLQSKLLRVLQESYIRRIGGSKDIPIDVRIIATVNESPNELMEKGLLRKDLYYRLNVINISIPPLRERKDDIPLLAERFMEKHNKKFGKELWMISDGALKTLRSYDYPGNVRELENIIEQAISMADNEHVLTQKHLNMPDTKYAREPIVRYSEGEPLDEYLASLEEQIITDEMLKSNGNISKAAESLGIRRQTLQHKLKKYGIR